MRMMLLVVGVLMFGSVAQAGCRKDAETFGEAKVRVLGYLFNEGVKSVRFAGLGCDRKACSGWIAFQKFNGVEMADHVGQIKVEKGTCKVLAYGYEQLGEELFTGAN